MKVEASNYKSNKKICPKCHSEIDDLWKFCPLCKEKLSKEICYACEHEINSQWKFCPYCKASAKMMLMSKGSDIRSNGKDANEWIKQMLRD